MICNSFLIISMSKQSKNHFHCEDFASVFLARKTTFPRICFLRIFQLVCTQERFSLESWRAEWRQQPFYKTHLFLIWWVNVLLWTSVCPCICSLSPGFPLVSLTHGFYLCVHFYLKESRILQRILVTKVRGENCIQSYFS